VVEDTCSVSDGGCLLLQLGTGGLLKLYVYAPLTKHERKYSSTVPQITITIMTKSGITPVYRKRKADGKC